MVLLSQLSMEYIDVIVTTLDFCSAKETVHVARIRVVGWPEVSWKFLQVQYLQ